VAGSFKLPKTFNILIKEKKKEKRRKKKGKIKW
jgi:hypothetical protein